MSFLTNHFATQVALHTATMMLQQSHRRQQEENERHRRQQQEEENQNIDTMDATRYTAPEAYVPKHAKKEEEPFSI